MVFFYCLFFFFKQKTAYEMRISDWSSDVCSSDLRLLTQAGRDAIPPDVGSKDSANVHPQDRRQMCIISLRVIIHGHAPARDAASGLPRCVKSIGKFQLSVWFAVALRIRSINQRRWTRQ